MYQWCPYGRPGDLLWVRETHGIQLKLGESPDYPKGLVVYRADLPEDSNFQYEGGGSAWRPSIHMPRWASRITLEITGVRVERVQDISEKDAIAEGAAFRKDEDGELDAFNNIWDIINEKRGYSWDNNPWVWVIEFKKVKP